MKTMLLSFDPETFAQLESNNMKFEYRKVLPEEETTVFFYVTRPVMAISGIAHFGKRELLTDWKERYSNKSFDVQKRIDDYLTDCKYVAPILDYQKTISIPLKRLLEDVPGFVVPRMYYFIDDTNLLSYLNEKMTPVSEIVKNSFECISDNDICP